MDTHLPASQKMRGIILKESLIPLLKLLVESSCQPNCADLSETLNWFQNTGHGFMKDNNNQVCFDNMKRMYLSNEIPLNVFWISCVNTDDQGYYHNPFNFLDDLNSITQNILSNAFKQTHEWYFDHGSHSGVFLYFHKTMGQENQFISIFLAFKNGDGVQTLTDIKKGK